MDVMEAIRTRRSIRRYTGQPVPDETLRCLLEAAMVAPTAMDQRPWHFVVVRDRARLDRLADGMEHCDMLREATLGLLICGDPRLEKLAGFWEQDCAACAENVLLAAHAEGLGAVWVAVHPLEDRIAPVREVLGVPPDIVPFAIVSAGFPAETLLGEDRFDPTRVHHECWGGE